MSSVSVEARLVTGRDASEQVDRPIRDRQQRLERVGEFIEGDPPSLQRLLLELVPGLIGWRFVDVSTGVSSRTPPACGAISVWLSSEVNYDRLSGV
jgi:hypothetical protein